MKLVRNFCVLSRSTIIFVQQNAMTKGINFNKVPKRTLKLSPTFSVQTTSTSFNNQNSSAASGEIKFQPYDIIDKLNDNERESLREALEHFNSDQLKHKLEGELASNKWSARIGRGVHSTDVDSTGSYCQMPEQKLVDGVPRPSKDDLYKMMLVNAVPFIGFGFLDNFFMIIAGDYIEHTIGMYMCISTMAAAGFGNTISDVLGLGLAHYVEMFCEWLGLRPPRLTTAQLESTTCRRFSSFGRALGIIIGCLLGMFPLWFINKPPKTKAVDNETK